MYLDTQRSVQTDSPLFKSLSPYSGGMHFSRHARSILWLVGKKWRDLRVESCADGIKLYFGHFDPLRIDIQMVDIVEEERHGVLVVHDLLD